MDTRTVIDRYYETVNAGDWDAWLTLFADDVVVDEQLAGHVEGVKVLAGAVDVMKRGYSKFLMLPEHSVIEGDQAAVMWHCQAANATGVPIDVRGANYFRVENGKIVYMSNFHDKGAFAPFTEQKL
jgi:ketosteroid isomerase-like protein